MSVLDFAALPPEVNSGRMYAGAGAGPLVAAAAAWDELASELSSAATSYQSVISGLTSGSWLGPTSATMAAAAAPYVGWINTTAAQAEQTASQARTAAAAYEAAFSATVPPPVIATNRSQLASLVATNILGQNTAAIAATESLYGEMWAQDAAAMYGYAGASASATQLTPFSAAPQTTNASGTATQAAAATAPATANAAATTVPQLLQQLGSANGPFGWLVNLLNSPWVTGYEALTSAGALAPYATLSDGVLFSSVGALFTGVPAINAAMIPFTTAVQGAAAASAAPAADAAGSVASGAGAAGLGDAEVSAGLARAASIGGLSVPQSWGTAAPEIRLASLGIPAASLNGLPGAAPGISGFSGGMPMGPIGSVVNAPRNSEPSSRYRTGAKVVAQTGGQPAGSDDKQPRWANFDEFAPDVQDPRSERDELNDLRKAITAVAKEREVLKRSAALLIKEAMYTEGQ